METAAQLERLPLFGGVSEHDIKRLLRRYVVRRFAPRQLIFGGQNDLHRFYLMLQGTVKTYVYSSQGQRQIIHIFYPGDVFGGLVFGDDPDPRPWAEAVDDVLVVTLDEAEFKGLMQHYPVVCLNVFHHMVEHHRTHVRRMQTLIHTKASHRLVLTLLHLGDLQGDRDADVFQLPPFTHDDFANMIGVVRSTVSELMGRLRRSGVVSGRRGRLQVTRPAANRFLASPRS